MAAWRDANRESWRAYQIIYRHNRRIRKRKNGGSFTRADVEIIRARQSGLCAACGVAGKLEIDHIVAVANGGSGDPSNLQLLCGHCNKSKGARDCFEWATERGFIVRLKLLAPQL